MAKHEIWELAQYQSLALEQKITMTKSRIMDWYDHWNGKVFVSISGKDSTVLLDIVRKLYPDVPAVFVDTGLEYPEVRELAMSHSNVIVLRPKKPFWQVIRDEGYPIISKEVSECICNARKHLLGGGKYSQHYRKICGLGEYTPQRVQKILGTLKKRNSSDKSAFNLEKYKPLLDVPFRISSRCCGIMKKDPLHKFTKQTGLKPMTGQMAQESRLRKQQWLKNGCNGFDMKEPISNPMAFWTEQDVLQYIKKYNIKIPSVYGKVIYEDLLDGMEQLSLQDISSTKRKLCTTGCSRTGCIYCGFAVHFDKGKSRFQMLKETHPRLYEYCIGGGEFDDKGMWVPNKKGLGLAFVFDTINKIYGENFIRYK